jgi:superfamily II DNA/RNA helicase
MDFESLGLGPELLKAVAECGYTEPTPIQAKAIPAILMTRDVLGLAQTGTGKTASFTLPMIEILSGGVAKARMPRSLVLAPTRELAAQVAENFEKYGKYHKLNKALLVGGESVIEQKKILDRGVDVLIATPGRLLDLFERGSILLNDIKVLVIDEADRMMDMGFIPDIEKIVSFVPPIRQTLLFSATMPKEIKRIADKFLTNPKEISVAAPAATATNVHQGLVWSPPRRKKETLAALLQQEKVKNAFVFCNRKRDIDGLAKWLKNKNYDVAALHGDMDQSKRYEVLEAFKNDEFRLLICSDVAARGLDVAAVSHVFNFDVPMHPDDYVHRIGRTGRAGMDGRAFTIAAETDDDRKYINAIEKLIGNAIEIQPMGGQKESASHSQNKPQNKPHNNSGKQATQKNKPSHSRDRDDKPENKPNHQNKQSPQKTAPQKESAPVDSVKQQPQPQKAPQQNKPNKQNKQSGQDDSSSKGFGDELPDFFKN